MRGTERHAESVLHCGLLIPIPSHETINTSSNSMSKVNITKSYSIDQ